MKKFTSTFCLILMVFLTLNLVGCNTKDNDDVKAQDVIIKYLNTYYTIDKNDIVIYEKIMAGSKDIYKLTKNANEKFKSLLTDAAYGELTASRASYGRIKDAYEKKYYVTVKDIKLEKDLEDKENETLIYNYDIELSQTSISGNETKNVKDRKQITVSKVKNSWKVEHFSTTNGYQ